MNAIDTNPTTKPPSRGGEGPVPERLGTYGGCGSGCAELSSVPSVPSDPRNPWSRQADELESVLDTSSTTLDAGLDAGRNARRLDARREVPA